MTPSSGRKPSSTVRFRPYERPERDTCQGERTFVQHDTRNDFNLQAPAIVSFWGWCFIKCLRSQAVLRNVYTFKYSDI